MKFGWINLFGAIIVLLIIIPNIIYALRNKNETEAPDVPQYLTVCEQIGRYGCIILMWLPLMVWEFGFKSVNGKIRMYKKGVRTKTWT